MSAHDAWRDPIVVAVDTPAAPFVRVVRRRDDPVQVRTEIAYNTGQPEPFIKYPARIGGMRMAIDGLETIVCRQAERLAARERQLPQTPRARLKEARGLIEDVQAETGWDLHDAADTLTAALAGNTDADADDACSNDDPAGPTGRHEQETIVALWYSERGHGNPTHTSLYRIRHTCPDPMQALREAAIAYVRAHNWPFPSFCWGDAVDILPGVDGLLARYGVRAAEPLDRTAHVTVHSDEHIVNDL